jgi:UDP-glucose 4-epimerase
MKYLVTGGAGFIGSHICDALIERGDSVKVIDNFSTGTLENIQHLKSNERFEIVAGSILDKNLMDEHISSVDFVIHMAAAVGVLNIVDKALESLVTNLHGTENILISSDKFNKPVLIASTSEIYGKNNNVPLFGRIGQSYWLPSEK